MLSRFLGELLQEENLGDFQYGQKYPLSSDYNIILHIGGKMKILNPKNANFSKPAYSCKILDFRAQSSIFGPEMELIKKYWAGTPSKKNIFDQIFI